jgi:hypothetical protein
MLLRGMLWGFFAMMTFCATLSVLLTRVPLALAFLAALAAALTANVLTVHIQRGIAQRRA